MFQIECSIKTAPRSKLPASATLGRARMLNFTYNVTFLIFGPLDRREMASTTIEDADGINSIHVGHSKIANIETANLRAIITNLYLLIAQAHDYQGTGTNNAMKDEL